jgi:hypothetical protein
LPSNCYPISRTSTHLSDAKKKIHQISFLFFKNSWKLELCQIVRLRSPIPPQTCTSPLLLSCSLIDLLQLQERIFVSQTITRKRLTKSPEFPNPICCNSTGGWCCASDTARTLTAVRECFHAESSLFEETGFFHPVRPEFD